MRRIFISALTLVFLILVFLLSFSTAPAKEEDKKPEKANEGYVGAEICQTCHPQVYDNLAKTAMGVLFLKHPQNAGQRLGCETCHGPGTQHVGSGGKSHAGQIRFTQGTTTPASVQDAVCLKCHQKRERLFWCGSPHDTHGITCTKCHAVHTGPGAMARHQLARLTVEDTCAPCHKEQVRAEMKFSHHPLREGKMDCASCHNPHGTTSDHLIKGLTNKELCFNCHAQYRGPVLFQHPPVMEDCFNCHQPHGSNFPSLLKAPVERLCRECHISFHASGATASPWNRRVGLMVGGGCLNCHRNIHGSNNFNGNLFFH
ncbi:MAG: DmsE family decaheme c-type cytochrome [Desulfobaccales bacterium]